MCKQRTNFKEAIISARLSFDEIVWLVKINSKNLSKQVSYIFTSTLGYRL